jgi:transcriptional regulator with XRE-family HTH domain
MDESFGTRLRLQRERQQVALTAIAEQTKIKRSLLEGLERDDVSHWPEGIFRRAFVRAYAQAIGLAPDLVVREFLELYPDPVDVIPAVSAAAPNTDGASVSRRPPTRLRYLVASAIAALRSALERVQRREPAFANVRVVDRHSAVESVPASSGPDLVAAAHLCTSLGRVLDARDVAPLLEDAARILDAVGLIVWSWDPRARTLRPSLAHGYSDRVLAQLPKVRRDSDNAIAAAFRSAEPRIVDGAGRATGAVVVPLMAPRGCVGVLALELRDGGEQHESVRALATILAAQMANLAGSSPLAEAVNA